LFSGKAGVASSSLMGKLNQEKPEGKKPSRFGGKNEVGGGTLRGGLED